MSIKQKSTHFYTLCGQILQQVSQNPYLGVLLSEDLKWEHHISKVSSKAASTLGLLRRNLKACPQNCKRLAYISMIRSSLEYASSIWDPYLQKDINKLEKIQRRATRFIINDYSSTQEGIITESMKSLDLPTLQKRRKTNRLSLFYKITNRQLPAICPDDYIKPITNSRRRGKPARLNDFITHESLERSGRKNDKCFQILNGKTDQFVNSFIPRTVVDWNNLNNDIVHSPSANSFRARLLQEV